MFYKVFLASGLCVALVTAGTLYTPPDRDASGRSDHGEGASVAGAFQHTSPQFVNDFSAESDHGIHGLTDAQRQIEDNDRLTIPRNEVDQLERNRINFRSSLGDASVSKEEHLRELPIHGSLVLTSSGDFVHDSQPSSESRSFDAEDRELTPRLEYEEHFRARDSSRAVLARGPKTVISKVTRTHILRIPSTSDVWVTSVSMVKVTVSQQSTVRSFTEAPADTVTSVVRVTNTPVVVATRTAHVAPTRTLVSVFTRFTTETRSVELWQPIVHLHTSYEVETIPVMRTQTLIQRLYTTTTYTHYAVVTSTRRLSAIHEVSKSNYGHHGYYGGYY